MEPGERLSFDRRGDPEEQPWSAGQRTFSVRLARQREAVRRRGEKPLAVIGTWAAEHVGRRRGGRRRREATDCAGSRIEDRRERSTTPSETGRPVRARAVPATSEVDVR